MSHSFKVLALLFAGWLAAGTAQAQDGRVTGTVTDAETGQSLPGTNVFIPSLALGASADLDGHYTIEAVPAGTYELVARFVGFKEVRRTVEVMPGETADVDFVLSPDYLGLEEVVVVGYGTQKRAAVAGAVSSLQAEKLDDIPVPSVDNALQGRLAGVQVTQNSGNPGAAITVRVRGATSITAGNEPLYVIDGVPVNQGNYSGIDDTFGGQGVSALADLNPHEIASMEVLKDASAAAIYGSRASNGVVLITTKRGAEGEPQIEINTYAGVQREWNRVDLLGAADYIDVYNESILNDYGLADYIGYTDDEVANYIEVEPGTDTDWLETQFRPAAISSVSMGVRGGTAKTRYYVSGSAFNQEGVIEGFGYERLNGRVNLDYEATDRLGFGTNVSLARGVTLRSRGDNTIYGPFANSIAVAPIYPVYTDSTETEYFDTNYANPVGLSRENEAEERTIRILGSTFADYELASWLTARATVGVDHLTLRSRLYDSPVVGLAVGSDGSGTAANSYVTKVNYDGTLNFDRAVGEGSLSGVVGVSYETNETEYSEVTGTQFPNEQFRFLTSAATITDGTSSLTDWNMFSTFGRLSYTWQDRLTTTFNVRRDGSSRFGADHRYGIFPSVSVVWNVSEEPFMQEQGVFSDLRVRTSYGVTGNQYGLGNFDSRSLYYGGANYGDLPGISYGQLGNDDLKWETTRQFNVGGDVSFFDDRLGLSGDVYVKNTDDLLLNRPIPATSGFSVLTSNVGSIENVGAELAVRAQILRGSERGLTWTADFNISTNANEVTGLVDDEPINTGFASRIEVGQPLGVFYGYETDGLFRDQDEVDAHAFQTSGTAPGDVRFVDQLTVDTDDDGVADAGDGVITAADRVIIGNPWADYTGGLTNTLAWRGFDASVFFQFSLGNDIYNATRIYSDAFGSGFDNNTTRALDRWTPENPDASEPRATFADPNGNTRTSDRFIEDGSYVRLKNLVVGYTLPETLAGRLGFDRLRVYAQAQNLLTLTGYSGFDPEVNYAGNTDVVRGTDFYTLPQARSFTLGVNVGL